MKKIILALMFLTIPCTAFAAGPWFFGGSSGRSYTPAIPGAIGQTTPAAANFTLLGVGPTLFTPLSILHLKESSNASPRGLIIENDFAGTNGPRQAFYKSRTGATIVNGDSLGYLSYNPHDGTNYLETASIKAISNGTVATGSIPTDLTFNTGATSAAEWMRISSAGIVSGPSFSFPGATFANTLNVGKDSSAVTDLLINPTTKTSGNLIDAQVGGSSKFSVNYAGVGVFASTLQVTGNLSLASGSQMIGNVGAATAGNSINLDSGVTKTNTSGQNNIVRITSTINQPSGTGSNTALNIAVTETQLGSGTQKLTSMQAGAAGTTEMFAVTNKGFVFGSLGANVASGTTITPTGAIFHVTGVTAVVTINIPYTGWNGQITIIPDGIFATTTAGNIALVSTSVVNKALIMTYDSNTAKWYPSY
jgi:hypothetical protein